MIDQNTENQIIEAENPKAIFIAAVAISPPANRSLGDVLDPKTPDKNFETPYMMGKREVNAPICSKRTHVPEFTKKI